MKRNPASSHLQSLWRLRACETRAIAEQLSDPDAKRIVLEVARRCDRLVALIALVQAVTRAGSPTVPTVRLS